MHDPLKATFITILRTIATAVAVSLIVFVIVKAAAPGAHYISWLQYIITGKWGHTYPDSEPVLTAIVERLSPTLELILVSFILALVLGLAYAVISVRLSRPIMNYIVLALQCIPFFWLAIAFQVVSARGRSSRWGYASTDHFNMTDHLWHLMIPASLLVLFQLPAIVEYFGERVTSRTLCGVVRLFGDRLPEMLTATIITEIAFAWPGEGRLFFNALSVGDVALLIGLLLFSAIFVLAVRFIGELFATLASSGERVQDV